MKTEKNQTPTFTEWIKTLSVDRLMQFGIGKSNAESFSHEVKDYGLLAIDANNITPSSQIELCNAYAYIYRVIEPNP